MERHGIIMKKVGITASVIGVIIAIVGIILNIIQKNKISASISIIGGVDGPTSIFLAGKVGSMPVITGIVIGIILLIIGVILAMRKK